MRKKILMPDFRNKQIYSQRAGVSHCDCSHIAAIQQHLKKTLAGLMKQLPCNSLYCVSTR